MTAAWLWTGSPLKEFKQADPAYYLWLKTKDASARRKQSFDILPEDLVIGTECPILGIPLRFETAVPTDNSISVDRIDNNKGYVKGNVQVISNLANRMKTSATPKQLLKFAFWIYKTYSTRSNRT